MNLNQYAANEILKSTSTYLRTISLGFMAFALIEPMRSPEASFKPFIYTSLFMAIFTFAISIVILRYMKEIKK